MRKSEWVLLAIGVLGFVTAAVAYPHLPPVVASHWNVAGVANGYVSRAWRAFLFPAIIMAVILLFLAIPRIDPRRENIAKFRSSFDALTITLALVLYYIYALTLLWNFGYSFHFLQFLIPAFALLLFVLGMILPHLEFRAHQITRFR